MYVRGFVGPVPYSVRVRTVQYLDACLDVAGGGAGLPARAASTKGAVRFVTLLPRDRVECHKPLPPLGVFSVTTHPLGVVLDTRCGVKRQCP
jgi:hypothetical protein